MNPLLKMLEGLKKKESSSEIINKESQKVYGRKFKHLTYDERKKAGLIRKFN